jgi:hypothetical protein
MWLDEVFIHMLLPEGPICEDIGILQRHSEPRFRGRRSSSCIVSAGITTSFEVALAHVSKLAGALKFAVACAGSAVTEVGSTAVEAESELDGIG